MKRLIIVVIVLFLAGAAVVFRQQVAVYGEQAWLHGQQAWQQGRQSVGLATPQAPDTSADRDAGLVASGMFESNAISVGSLNGGRIVALHVAEGATVRQGDLIAEMDTQAVDAELAQAERSRDVAAAQLALLRARVRDADLAVARAAVTQTQASAAAAYTAWQDATALIDAPRDLDVKIANAETQLRVADEQVKVAQANAAAADLQQGLAQRTDQNVEGGVDVTINRLPDKPTIHVEVPSEILDNLRLNWNLSSQQTWQAYARLNAALTGREAVRQALADLRAQKTSPLTLQAQARSAEAAYHTAQAAIAPAQAQVDVLLAGARPEQIQAAEAQVRQAEAAIAALHIRRDQARIQAPSEGTVTSVVLHEGEVAAPAAPIVRLAGLGTVTLTVYVAEPDLGQVQLGQTAQVKIDSFPNRLFPGQVTYIAGQAEFTPKNVQTRQERTNTVYAVKISLPNPEQILKPGMPADAYLGAPPDGGEAADSGPFSAVTLPALVLPGQTAAGDEAAQRIRVSGTIEGRERSIAAEIGGRVAATWLAEGDAVQRDQAMVELDPGDWDARHAQAQATVETALAELASVKAPAREVDIAQAEARVAQARAGLAAAEAELENGRTLRANPQDLDAQINSAQAQIPSAAMQVDLVRAQLHEAEVRQASLPSPGSDADKTRKATYDQAVLAAQAMVQAAQVQLEGAQATLARLQAIRSRPVALDANVHRAQGQVAQATTVLSSTLAVLAQVQAPAQPEAIALAERRVAQSQAALQLLQVQRAKMIVSSPITGTVTSQVVHAGEVAEPGIPLYKVVDLATVKLVIYVPTAQIGQVRLGQDARVTVDGYPGQTFAGKVTHINDQAEFTPKNVQTEAERVRTVFAVEIELPNPEGKLKPGMPADAELQ